MYFIGYSEHTIDEKNRLAIPAKFRSRLNADRDGVGFVLTIKQNDEALCLYTERGFEGIAGKDESTFRPAQEQSEWELGFFSTAEQVEPDSQGRIIIPPRMLSSAGLSREVVICGVRDHMEIHAKEAYDRRMKAQKAMQAAVDASPNSNMSGKSTDSGRL